MVIIMILRFVFFFKNQKVVLFICEKDHLQDWGKSREWRCQTSWRLISYKNSIMSTSNIIESVKRKKCIKFRNKIGISGDLHFSKKWINRINLILEDRRKNEKMNDRWCLKLEITIWILLLLFIEKTTRKQNEKSLKRYKSENVTWIGNSSATFND